MFWLFSVVSFVECHYLKTYIVLLYSLAFVDGKIFNGSRLILPEDVERQ